MMSWLTKPRQGRAPEPASRTVDSPDDDAALVAVARARGPAGQRAFACLVARHEAWLLRYLRYMLRSSTDAEETAQEVLLRAYSGLAQLADGASFRSWLRVIATRLAYNRTRDQRTRRDREREAGVLRGEHLDAIEADGGLAARDSLEKVLGRLSYPYREILLLRYVEELPVEEIAALLDIGLSAAKMRLKRAREHFRSTYRLLADSEVADAPF